LAGGLGTRISEESLLKPKPMIEIGGKPVLWHIMNIYAYHGQTEFIVACGYKAEVIKNYFINFYANNHDVSVDLATGETVVHKGEQTNWKIHIVDTGLHTETGGRIKRLKEWLKDSDTFLVTYGDGLSDVNISALIDFHNTHRKLATMTTVLPPARFGRVVLKDQEVCKFDEKPKDHDEWINGGFFVFNRGVLDYIEGDGTILERQPLQQLARDGQLIGYRHTGFWSCMDTLKEKNILEEMWASGNSPWLKK
jgi:glucose-1-phosphate cytidylyltransferase